MYIYSDNKQDFFVLEIVNTALSFTSILFFGPVLVLYKLYAPE